MGMDALTNVAFETLSNRILPRLIDECRKLGISPATGRKSSDDWQFLIYEARELLGLMLKWSGEREGMTDTEALSLMLGADPGGAKSLMQKYTNLQGVERKCLYVERKQVLYKVTGAIVAECLRKPSVSGSALQYGGESIGLVEPGNISSARLLAHIDSMPTEELPADCLCLPGGNDAYVVVVNSGDETLAICADNLHFSSSM
jgi:hypothetical protein